MSADLKINISADASQAAAGFKLAATSTKDFGSALQDARDKVETFRAKLELLNASALKGAPGKALAQDLKLATAELKTLETQAGIAGTATTNAFTKAYSGIRQLAYILPGIGIAGIFNLLGEGLINLFNHTKEVDQATKDYQDTVNKVIGSTAEEATRVEVLVSALQSGKLSRQETKGAIQELQRIAPDYFSSLKAEKSNIDQITAAYNNYNNALVKSIENQLKTADLTKAIQDRLTAANNFPAADAFVKQQQALGKSLNDIVTDNTKAFKESVTQAIQQSQQASDLGIKGTRNLGKAIKENADTNKAATKSQIEGLDTLLVALQKEQEILKTIDVTKSGIKAPGINDDAALNKQIAAINKEISALEELRKQGVATRADVQELFTLKIAKVDLELPKTGFTPAQATALKDKLQDEATKALAADGFKIDVPQIFVKNLDKIPLVLPDKAIVIDTESALKSAIAAGKGMGLVLRKGLADGLKQVDVTESVNALLNSSLVTGLENLGSAIGAAITSGNFGKVLQSVGNTVGQFIIDLGKILIQSGIKIAAIKNGFKVLAENPVLAIAAGIAAVAIGTIIKNAASNSASKSPTFFAAGGIVTGPTNAIIGEAGPEVVFPLNQLDRFLQRNNAGGGTHLSFEPLTNRITGGEIHQVWAVANKKNQRLGGPTF